MVALKTALLLLGTLTATFASPASTDDVVYDINGELMGSLSKRHGHGYSKSCRNDNVLQALKNNKAKASPFCSTYLRSTKTTIVTPTATKTIVDRRTTTATVRTTTRVTAQVTNTVTTQETDTVTVEVKNTVTEDITDTVTEQATDTVAESVTSVSTETTTITETAPAPTVTQNNSPHCRLNGFGSPQYSAGAGPSSAANFADCKQFCSGISAAVSFGYGSGQCACYSADARTNTRSAATSYYFYDLTCSSEFPPAQKRELVERGGFPAYIPCRDSRRISSACGCLITRPASPITKTATAKNCKTVTVRVTSRTTVTTIKRNTIRATKSNTVTATRTATATVTDHDTITATRLETVTSTNFATVTITDSVAVVETDTARSTTTPPAVTVTIADTPVYGS